MSQPIYAEDILELANVKPSKPKAAPEEALEVSPVYAEDILANHTQLENQVFDETPAYVEQSFADRVGSAWSKRADKVSDYAKLAFADTEGKSMQELLNRPDAMDILKVGLGNVAGGFMDLTGELVMEGIDLIVPDDLEDSIKQKVVQGLNYLSTNDYVAEGVEALQGGVESYNEWRNDNPKAATELEAVVDLATFFTPAAKRKDLMPARIPENPELTRLGNAASKQVEKLSAAFKKAATNQIDKRKREAAYEYVMPVNITEKRLSDVTPRSLTKDAKIEPNQLELDAIEHISKYNLNPNKGYLHNWKVIDNANKKEAQVLRTYVTAKGRNKVVSKDVLTGRMQGLIGRIAQDPLAQPKDAQRVLGSLAQDINQMIKVAGNKPVDLLDLRQDIDKYLETKFKFFTKDQPVWLDTVGKSVRKELNDVLDETIGDGFVSKSLRDQHLSFTALKGLGPKAAKEIDRQSSVLYKSLARVLGENVRMSRLLTYSTVGVSGYAAMMGVLPWISGAALSVGLGAMAVKGAISPSAKKAIAYTLDATSAAIKATNNKDMLKELRLGRSLMLELSQLPVDESLEPQEERDNYVELP